METNFIKDGEEMIPTNDRVLVRIKKLEETSKGGVLLPDEVVARMQRNEVRASIVAVGPLAFAQLIETVKEYDLDERAIPKIGDSVVIPKHAGQALATDGKVDYETRFIHPEEIIAILRKKDD